MPQYRRHTIYRPTAILLQQRPLLRVDGHDEAALQHDRHDHDVLVGTCYHASQWRREHKRTDEED
jgi:hypothetical protein